VIYSEFVVYIKRLSKKSGKRYQKSFPAAFCHQLFQVLIIILRSNRRDFLLFLSKEQIRELHEHRLHNEILILSGTKA
jgi:hypothetical protein